MYGISWPYTSMGLWGKVRAKYTMQERIYGTFVEPNRWALHWLNKFK